MYYFLLCLLNVLVMVCGQLLFKIGTKDKEIKSFGSMLNMILSPYVIFAITLYVGGVLLWTYILTKVPLSYAYPVQALAFPLVTVCSLFIFQETIPLNRWIGVGIIVFGALLASR